MRQVARGLLEDAKAQRPHRSKLVEQAAVVYERSVRVGREALPALKLVDYRVEPVTEPSLGGTGRSRVPLRDEMKTQVHDRRNTHYSSTHD